MGARALADAEGHPFPAQDTDRFYGLMPRPPGSNRDWVAKLVGPGGLTPQELVRAIRANPQPDDLPEGKEIMILTEMTLEISDAGAAVDALRRAGAEFQHEGREGNADVFSWTRPYPKGHWSPLSSLGGRQILGGVRVSGREIAADAKTLSMGRRLYHHLTAYGFLSCFAATCAAAVNEWLGRSAPYLWWSAPVMLGTVAGIGLVVGPAGLLALKARSDAEPHPRTGMDVSFLLLLLLTSATGFLVLFLRATPAMGLLLLVHLGAVMGLFLTMPYGKFVHGFYRYAALVRYAMERSRPHADAPPEVV